MSRIYEFTEYKPYLKAELALLKEKQRGVLTRFAEHIEVRGGYVTQILSGKADLSPEQAELANAFLQHDDEEAEYFHLLVSAARARTLNLRRRYELLIERSQKERLNLKKRFKAGDVPENVQAQFYGTWQFLAILTLIAIPGYNTRETVSTRLRLPIQRVTELLELMRQWGVVEFKNGKYSPGTLRLHLGRDSYMVSKHHQNWRLQAIQAIESRKVGDIHYSAVANVSKKDAEKLKKMIVDFFEKVEKVIVPSEPEEAYGLCMDFFEL